MRLTSVVADNKHTEKAPWGSSLYLGCGDILFVI